MERRKRDRRDFSYYMRVMNENTGELVGHLADISISGFNWKAKNRFRKIPNILFESNWAAIYRINHLLFLLQTANGVNHNLLI